MEYKLALELKEAGWPQRFTPSIGNPEAAPDYPTLSELIEACGKKFDSLDNTLDGWRVYFYGDTALDYVWHQDMTSAVATCWLALNKPTPPLKEE